jgi:hypothetical protein
VLIAQGTALLWKVGAVPVHRIGANTMRRVEIIQRAAKVVKVTVTAERITIKTNPEIEPLMNIPWLVDTINTVIPLEAPSLRGAIFRNYGVLTLRISNGEVWEEIRFDKFWKGGIPCNQVHTTRPTE